MNKIHILTLILFSTMCLFNACKNDDDDMAGLSCEEYHWEYTGEEAPDTWNTCFLDCGGQDQSPVNINVSDTSPDAGLTTLELDYKDVPIEVLNNGHTIEFEHEAGSTFRLNGVDYNLLQFHFHTLSEHTVNGNHFPMEVHLVHQDPATGNLAVIGIFFEEGNENAFLASFDDDLPTAADEHYSSEDLVNATDLLPSDLGYYTYDGSLTTPPCSEVVTWFVLKMPIEASASQIQQMHDILHDNYRPVQDLNGRVIRESI